MKVLILGVTGMLGSTLFRFLSNDPSLEVIGTARANNLEQHFSKAHLNNIITGINIENPQSLLSAFIQARPDVVINCIGLVKQLSEANDPLKAIFINAQLPHQLSELCKLSHSRLIHISTDCVFSGNKGNYVENDIPDAKDLYGRSKLLGELSEAHTLTIRTSIIGHELEAKKGLLEWFLSQQNEVKGFSKAIFSGFTVIELSKVIQSVLQRPDLTGIYHAGTQPINKYDLLSVIAKTYNKQINIIKDENFVIDRSLNSERFYAAIGYTPPKWPELISNMHNFSYAS